MKYIIIGNGTAGIEAALAIRRRDKEGDITVISSSPHPFYYRPRLIEYLGKEMSPEELVIHKDDFYKKNSIKTELGIEIENISPADNIVSGKNGLKYEYDRLLIAAGAQPFIPPISGIPMNGVFTLREINDADRIRAHCKDIGHLVIAGGGLLGLETAHALLQSCREVTVVEASGYLLQRQLDKDGSSILKDMLEAKGLSFIFEDTVAEVDGDENIERIALNSGRELPADALILSAGVRPSVSLASEAGLKVERGIIIDDYMQTSAENIYAAGDCAQHNGYVYGLWTIARDQGRLAGMNMAGEISKYTGSVPAAVLKVTDISLYSAGDFNMRNAKTLIEKGDKKYKKFIYYNDTPIGSIIIGDKEAIKKAQRVMLGNAGIEEMIKLFK